MGFRLKFLSFFMASAAVFGLLTVSALLRENPVSASGSTWLAEGDPVIVSTELSPGYTPPYSYNYNHDCDTRKFEVIIREAKPLPSRQTEKIHRSSCAVLTARGMSDGEYLDAGVPAGKFVGMSGFLYAIPGSTTLLGSRTVINTISLDYTFYDTIVPEYSANTGEVSYRVKNPTPLKSSAGVEYTVRPGSLAFSRNGKWMVVETNGMGYVRVNIESKQVTPFGPRVSPRSGSTNHHAAISDDGRFAAIEVSSGSFKIYDISQCQGDDSVTRTCPYKNIETFLESKFPGYSSSYYIRFVSSDLLTFVSNVRDADNVLHKHWIRMSPSGHEIPSVNYLALGDSFSSGEGAYDYEIGTDEPENMCHLSQKSYPYLTASSLGISDFRSVACSGAKTEHYFKNRQSKIEIPTFLLPGQVEQSQYLRRHSPNVVTISMIGNDIGFSNKLTKCIAGLDSCFHFREDRRGVAAEVASKFETLVNMYSDIKQSSNNSDTKVYVLGYPQLFAVDGECGVNVRLDREEREFSRGLVGYLNAVIRAATEKAGVKYIDVQDAFAGRQLCEQDEKAVNGLTAGGDVMKVVGNESYHPNALGQQLLSDALIDQSANLSEPMPEPDLAKKAPGEDSTEYAVLLGDSPNGSQFKRMKYTALEGVDVLIKNSPVSIKPSDFFKPNTLVDITFLSNPVHAGTLESDQYGLVSGDVMVPSDLSPGFHTINITGSDLSGKEMVLYKTVYIAASLDDFDGDGKPNVEEKCLTVESAGQDIDRDGVDDACDAVISDPPADTTPPIVIGQATREPDYSGWYNKDVDIKWLVTDPEPSSGAPSQPSNTIASAEGVHTYKSAESCDPLQNCTVGEHKISLDKSAPNINSIEWSDNPSKGPVQATVVAEDAISGVSEAEYYVGLTDPGFGQGIPLVKTADSSVFIANINLDPGLHIITFRVKDVAGNWSQADYAELVIEAEQPYHVIGAGIMLPFIANPSLLDAEQLVAHIKTGNRAGHDIFWLKRNQNLLCLIFNPLKTCQKTEIRIDSIEWVVPFGGGRSVIAQGRGQFTLGSNKTKVRARLFIHDKDSRLINGQDQITVKLFNEDSDPLNDLPIYEAGRRFMAGNVIINQLPKNSLRE